MSINLDKIRTADFAQLRAVIGELSSRELRELCTELEIAGLSRGSKKACAKAIFDAEVAHRKANGGLEPAPASSAPESDPEVAAQVREQVDADAAKPKPKGKGRKTKGKTAKKAASTKAPKKRAKKAKEPKEPPPPEPRVALAVTDIAESSNEAIEDLMKARGISFAEALDLLVKVGRSRLRATDRYYKEQVKARGK